MLFFAQTKVILVPTLKGILPIMKQVQLTIIPRARMGCESIAQEAERRMGY